MNGAPQPPSEPILLLATADWDNPFWTNKQHVARELARRGHVVIYVESLGLRRPTAGRRDLARLWRRLRRGLRPARQVEPGLWVCAPLVLPLHGWPGIETLNRRLLGACIAAACARAGVRPRLLWTYSPLTARLLDLSRYETTVYHAVDDIAAQPGMPAALIEAAERELVARADAVFATSPVLFERHAAASPNTRLFPNVADFDHFSAALTAEPPADLTVIPGPRIGFIGAVVGYKLDVALLVACARLRPSYSFILIGQIGEGDPQTDVSALSGAPNIHLVGPRPHAALPACLAAFDAAILPCPITPYTRAMFPMKLMEYLAAGRPVVATRLPALQPYVHLFHLADDAEGFAAALDAALAGGGAPLQARLETARAHTYARRTAAMLDEIAALRAARQ